MARVRREINKSIGIPSPGHLRPDPIPRNPRNSAAIAAVSQNRLKPNLTRIRAPIDLFISRLTLSLIAALLLGLTVCSAAAQALPGAAENHGELHKLLARFASIPGLSARFREEKHIALLIKPIVIQGSVYFAAPKRFARHVDQPEKSRLVIDQSELRIVDSTGTRSMSLASQSILRIIVGTFVQVLSGDRRAIERSYRIVFKGTAAGQWSMELYPKQEVLARVLEEVRVRGRDAVVEQLEIHETNGDRTATAFFDVDTSRRFSVAEQKRFFLIGSKP